MGFLLNMELLVDTIVFMIRKSLRVLVRNRQIAGTRLTDSIQMTPIKPLKLIRKSNQRRKKPKRNVPPMALLE